MIDGFKTFFMTISENMEMIKTLSKVLLS